MLKEMTETSHTTIASEEEVNTLKLVLQQKGFRQIPSQIKMMVTCFKQEYWVSSSPSEPFVVFTEVAFHTHVEVVHPTTKMVDWFAELLRTPVA